VGVEIVYFPYTMHTSSTQLRRALDLLTQEAEPGTGVGGVSEGLR
jgi:glycerol-3-phosphate cytidylyltransferase